MPAWRPESPSPNVWTLWKPLDLHTGLMRSSGCCTTKRLCRASCTPDYVRHDCEGMLQECVPVTSDRSPVWLRVAREHEARGRDGYALPRLLEVAKKTARMRKRMETPQFISCPTIPRATRTRCTYTCIHVAAGAAYCWLSSSVYLAVLHAAAWAWFIADKSGAGV